jgi:hypothetical protein
VIVPTRGTVTIGFKADLGRLKALLNKRNDDGEASADA